MADARYIGVLRQAYFLELLGEATYRQGSRKLRDGFASKWTEFEGTEVEMQRLLHQELQRVVGVWRPSRFTMRVAREVGYLAGILTPTLLGRIIKRVLNQRRYARWAVRFSSHNPRLWQALVEHELRQTDHFERRER